VPPPRWPRSQPARARHHQLAHQGTGRSGGGTFNCGPRPANALGPQPTGNDAIFVVPRPFKAATNHDSRDMRRCSMRYASSPWNPKNLILRHASNRVVGSTIFGSL
jgi:hypothetical protein